MAKKTQMTPKAASRIQSSVDRRGSGGDQGFKVRTSSAAAQNTRTTSSGGGKTSGGGRRGGKR